MKSLLIACALSANIAANASIVTGNDTLVVEKPNSVKIITTDSLQTVVIDGSSDNPHYKYQNTIQIVDSNYVSVSSINRETWDFSFGFLNRNHKKKSETNEVRMDLLIGFCSAPGMPAVADIRPFSSWEIWWIVSDAVFRPWANNHAFSIGVGLDWRNYRMTDEYRFVKSDNHLSIVDYPADAHPKFSRIKVFSINFPMRYRFNTKHFNFSLGPVININTYSSIKTRYTIDDVKYKDVSKDVRANPVTVDFMGTLGVKGLNVYFKYSPCNVISSSYGPKFKSLSFGILL